MRRVLGADARAGRHARAGRALPARRRRVATRLRRPLVVDGQVARRAVRGACRRACRRPGDPELVSAVADLASAAARERAQDRDDARGGASGRARPGSRTSAHSTSCWADRSERRRPTAPSRLVLFDLDGFKQMRTTSTAHVVGDEILREVGRVFLRVVRTEDEIFRVGGDEFALVVDGPSTPGRRGRRAVCGWRSGSSGAGAGCRRSRRASPRFPTTPARPSTSSGRRTSRSTRRSWPGRTVCRSSAASAREPVSAPLAASSWSPIPAKSQRGLRLLVVDDDPALRILLRTTFEVVDIEVDEADSADLARGADRRAPPGRRRPRREHARARTA